MNSQMKVAIVNFSHVDLSSAVLLSKNNKFIACDIVAEYLDLSSGHISLIEDAGSTGFLKGNPGSPSRSESILR